MSSTICSEDSAVSYKTHHRKSFRRGRRPLSSVSTSTSRSANNKHHKETEKNEIVSNKRRRSLSSDSDHHPSNRHTDRKKLSHQKTPRRKRSRRSLSKSLNHHSIKRSHSHRKKKEKSRRKHRKRNGEIVQVNEVIGERFKVDAVLGEGSFGQVLDCFDKIDKKSVAVKALKPLDNYKSAAMHEIEVLKIIASSENHEKSCCIEPLDFLSWNKHYFIVFPRLGKSVFKFLEDNHYHPYPVIHTARIIFQVLKATEFLNNIGLTHTDLKPENILFVNDSYFEEVESGKTVKVLEDTTIKIIDFGSATFENQHHSRTIQTRHYRAPEVILELGWTFPSDMWSIGCILFELLTGKCMFMTHENLEHLAMMERVLGPIPKSMIKATKRTSFFYKDKLDWNSDSKDGRYVKRNVKHLSHYWFNCESRDKRQGFDLVQEMLKFKPHHRVTVKKSFKHPFLDIYDIL